jgi:signal transduction histidine kinase
VVLLAFFIYRNYKTQKMYNALLSKEKKSHLAHIEAQSHVLSDIAHIQAHEVRGPVSAILGFVQIFNYDDPTDPGNKQVMEWIGVTAEKLDTVVRNVVSKENDLRSEHDNQGHNS